MRGHGLGLRFPDLTGFANFAGQVHWVMRGTLSLSVQSLLCFREQWSHLFEGPQTMQAFMWQEDLIGIVRFVNACLHKMSRWKARREGRTQTLEKRETSKWCRIFEAWPRRTREGWFRSNI